MVAKTKINETGDCIFNEQDAIDILYSNPEFDISKLFFDDIEKYNNSIKETNLDLPNIKTVPKRENLIEFDQKNIKNSYKNFIFVSWIYRSYL